MHCPVKRLLMALRCSLCRPLQPMPPVAVNAKASRAAMQFLVRAK